MAMTPKAAAQRLLKILKADRDNHLLRVDQYLRGLHDDPYMPETADAEYRLLAKRAVSNWMPLLINAPAQALYVDSFRRGRDATGSPTDTPEWGDWQRSRMDQRQTAIHRGALAYGHSFVVVEKAHNREGVSIRGLSALRTSALYYDPANDEDPYAVLTVELWPEGDGQGTATMWFGLHRYTVSFKLIGDDEVTVTGKARHGAKQVPVTRFAASVDLEGRTVGVIEPMIPLQNRINQTVFDLLVAQTYSSFKVRWVTGMAPPFETDPETGEPVIDPETGQPTPVKMDHNARRFLFAEDPEARFGTLDETPLNGYIDSIDMSVRHLSAVSQTPPHYLLGQIANISAEALSSAETALHRKVEEFRKNFGESWERVFRLAAELRGDEAGAENYSGEIVWRDMEQRSLAQAADALGKLKEQLGIPARGLWPRVPNVTQGELDLWNDYADEATLQGELASVVLPSNTQTTEEDAVA